MFMSYNEIIDDILLFGLDTDAKLAFRSIKESQLIDIHILAGQRIRATYKLWDDANPLTMLNYVPELVGGIDVNPKHPENMSYSIIRTLWQRLK